MFDGGSPRVTLLCLLPPGPRQVGLLQIVGHNVTPLMLLSHEARGGQCSPGRTTRLVPGGEPIEVVSHLQYLGCIVLNDCGMDTEISSRICKASSAFQSLYHILWHQRKIKTSTKIRVLSIISQVNGCWTLGSWVLGGSDC